MYDRFYALTEGQGKGQGIKVSQKDRQVLYHYQTGTDFTC